MNDQQMLKLIFKSKEYCIPLTSCYISDVNQDIYNQIKANQRYVVKSSVDEYVFISFVDHWVNNKIPNINSENIDQYEKLSQEFDRMKDLILLIRKITPKNDYYSLNFLNKFLLKNNQEKRNQLDQKIQKYRRTIEMLFKENEVDFNQFLQTKDELINYIKEDEINLIELMTKKTLNFDNGLTYSINDKKATSILFSCIKASNDILIPASLFYKSKEFKITEIAKNSFQFAYNIKSIQFSKNSNLHSINENAFFDSTLESISLPSSLVELKEGWCRGIMNLTSIKINHEKDENISLYKDEFIIGKSDNMIDTFDVLIFCRRDIETAIIPPFIKRISPYAFENCLKLKSIEFSDDSELLIIDKFSFSNTSIENITIPSSAEIIKKQAFFECKQLKKIEFEKNSKLKSIEEFAFQKSALESISLPSSVVELKEGWCRGIMNLTNIKINHEKDENISLYKDEFIIGKSDNMIDIFDVLIFCRRDIEAAIIPPFIKRISPYAFENCLKLKSVEFSNDSNLCIIDKKAFSYSSIESIIIPSTVTVISCCAFSNCENLTTVKFSNDSKLNSIGEEAFYNSGLTNIMIPSSVTTIKNGTFSSCEQLEKVEFFENSKLKKIERNSFSYSSLNTIVIPSHVKEIENYSFNKCEQLQKIEFQANSKLKFLGQYSFADSYIENIVIPIHITKIENSLFSNCPRLRKVECINHSKLKVIGKESFSSSNIDTLIIPSRVEEFQEGWCFNTQNLINITIIPSIEKNVYYFDNKFIIGKTEPKSNDFNLLIFAQRCIETAKIPSFINKISSYSFDRCTRLETVEFSNHSKLREISNNAFSYTSIKSIKIPNNVDRIGQNAFCGCKHLNSIEFSNNSKLRIIEMYTFLKSSIEFIKITASVVKIDEYAFNECTNLKKVEFEKNSKLITIESLAFTESSIESIKIPSTVIKIGDYAFSCCSRLKKIEFSHKSELRMIGNGAFFKSAIEHFAIPIHVMHIGEVTFSGCKKLKNIEIENHSELISIEKNAFDESSLIVTSMPLKLKKLLHLDC